MMYFIDHIKELEQVTKDLKEAEAIFCLNCGFVGCITWNFNILSLNLYMDCCSSPKVEFIWEIFDLIKLTQVTKIC